MFWSAMFWKISRDEIIDLYQALKKEKESFADLGIDFEEKAFYDILRHWRTSTISNIQTRS